MEKNDSKKHLLILSGPMGSGHVRAAAGVEAWAKKEYPELRVTNINVADFMGRIVRFIYARMYAYLVNNYPFLWGFVYYTTDRPPATSRISRFMTWLRHATAKNILREIIRQDADYILCTHYLSAELVDKLKAEGKVTAPSASLVTDYSLHNIYLQPSLEYFFVASDELRFRLEKSGIPPEKIHITGIPVFPEFCREFTDDEIKDLKQALGFNTDLRLILLMMGGESKDKLLNLTKMLLERFDNYAFVPLPGKNEQVLKQLNELKEQYPDRLFPVPFTKEVWKYLAVCGAVVSKPGGISTSECLAMRKPMIIMDPIPGQEERNADYLLERSVVAKAYDEISLIYKEVLLTTERLNYMLEQIDIIRRPDAGRKILEILTDK